MPKSGIIYLKSPLSFSLGGGIKYEKERESEFSSVIKDWQESHSKGQLQKEKGLSNQKF